MKICASFRAFHEYKFYIFSALPTTGLKWKDETKMERRKEKPVDPEARDGKRYPCPDHQHCNGNFEELK